MTTASLIEFMATEPESTLESIADEYQVTLFDVIKALPNKTIVSGNKFDEIWDEVTTWGSVLTVIRTPDFVVECPGELPSGFHRYGYFNLRGRGALSGHIKAENCQAIALIERPFKGMHTATIIFINHKGDSILKIFLGRDSHRELLTDQLTAFRTLATRLQIEQAKVNE